MTDLAILLRRPHQLPVPSFPVPEFWPFDKVRRRLKLVEGIPQADSAFLWARCAETEQQYREMAFVLPHGVVHGDAHRGNLIRSADAIVLGDLEEFGTGPREWDLTPTAIARQRFALPSSQYEAFATAYGFDVMAWEGYTVLQRIRELTMTTWLMQNVNESPAIAEEFALRVASMRGEPMPRPWRPF